MFKPLLMMLLGLSVSYAATAGSDPDWERVRVLPENNIWARYPLPSVGCDYTSLKAFINVNNDRVAEVATSDSTALYARCMAGVKQAYYSSQKWVLINIKSGDVYPEDGFYSQAKGGLTGNIWAKFPSAQVSCDTGSYFYVKVDNDYVAAVKLSEQKYLSCEAAIKQAQLDPKKNSVFVNIIDGRVVPEGGFFFMKNPPAFMQ